MKMSLIAWLAPAAFAAGCSLGGQGYVEVFDGEAVGFAGADLEAADIDESGFLAEGVEVLGGVALGRRGALSARVAPVVQGALDFAAQVFGSGELLAEATVREPLFELRQAGFAGLDLLRWPGVVLVDQKGEYLLALVDGMLTFQPGHALRPVARRFGRLPAVSVSHENDHDVTPGHFRQTLAQGRRFAAGDEILHHVGTKSGAEGGIAGGGAVGGE